MSQRERDSPSCKETLRPLVYSCEATRISSAPSQYQTAIQSCSCKVFAGMPLFAMYMPILYVSLVSKTSDMMSRPYLTCGQEQHFLLEKICM